MPSSLYQGGTQLNYQGSSPGAFDVERALLPGSDYDNISNRLVAAGSAAIDNAFGVAADDIDWVARYELEQLHGLPGGLVFPAVSGGDRGIMPRQTAT